MFGKLIRKYGLINATIITALMIMSFSLLVACLVNFLIGRPITGKTFLVSLLVPFLVAPPFIYVHFSLLLKLIKSERKLNDKSVEFGNLINNIPGMAYRGYPDWTTRIIPESKDICGYTEAEINSLGKGWLEVVHPEDVPTLIKQNRLLTDQENSIVQTYRVKSKSGSVCWVEDRKRSLFSDDGRYLGVDGIIFDVTEQRQMEENLYRAQKLESIGILAGGIAHDFNNILTGIIGNLSLLKSFLDKGKVGDAYDRITAAEKAAYRAQSLTYQLLTFSRGGAPVTKSISVVQLIEESVRFTLSGANVKSSFQVAPDLWFAEADPGQFSQVVQNIAINALQAMPGGGKLEVRLENYPVGKDNKENLAVGEYVKISICDSGSGIPQNLQSKIFDPFYTTKIDGTGLGLAICHSIMKKHNGNITLESAENQGTCFHLFIPASRKKQAPAGAEASDFVIGRGRILLMDDNELVKAVALELMIHAGYQVEMASDGVEAIDLYRKAMEAGQTYDAVILDLVVPGGMGGLETIAQLLKIDPAVKAIVSSGFSFDPVMGDFRKYGFQGAISKPYNLQELAGRLAEVLG